MTSECEDLFAENTQGQMDMRVKLKKKKKHHAKKDKCHFDESYDALNLHETSQNKTSISLSDINSFPVVNAVCKKKSKKKKMEIERDDQECFYADTSELPGIVDNQDDGCNAISKKNTEEEPLPLFETDISALSNVSEKKKKRKDKRVNIEENSIDDNVVRCKKKRKRDQDDNGTSTILCQETEQIKNMSLSEIDSSTSLRVCKKKKKKKDKSFPTLYLPDINSFPVVNAVGKKKSKKKKKEIERDDQECFYADTSELPGIVDNQDDGCNAISKKNTDEEPLPLFETDISALSNVSEKKKKRKDKRVNIEENSVDDNVVRCKKKRKLDQDDNGTNTILCQETEQIKNMSLSEINSSTSLRVCKKKKKKKDTSFQTLSLPDTNSFPVVNAVGKKKSKKKKKEIERDDQECFKADTSELPGIVGNLDDRCDAISKKNTEEEPLPLFETDISALSNVSRRKKKKKRKDNRMNIEENSVDDNVMRCKIFSQESTYNNRSLPCSATDSSVVHTKEKKKRKRDQDNNGTDTILCQETVQIENMSLSEIDSSTLSVCKKKKKMKENALLSRSGIDTSTLSVSGRKRKKKKRKHDDDNVKKRASRKKERKKKIEGNETSIQKKFADGKIPKCSISKKTGRDESLSKIANTTSSGNIAKENSIHDDEILSIFETDFPNLLRVLFSGKKERKKKKQNDKRVIFRKTEKNIPLSSEMASSTYSKVSKKKDKKKKHDRSVGDDLNAENRTCFDGKLPQNGNHLLNTSSRKSKECRKKHDVCDIVEADTIEAISIGNSVVNDGNDLDIGSSTYGGTEKTCITMNKSHDICSKNKDFDIVPTGNHSSDRRKKKKKSHHSSDKSDAISIGNSVVNGSNDFDIGRSTYGGTEKTCITMNKSHDICAKNKDFNLVSTGNHSSDRGKKKKKSCHSSDKSDAISIGNSVVNDSNDLDIGNSTYGGIEKTSITMNKSHDLCAKNKDFDIVPTGNHSSDCRKKKTKSPHSSDKSDSAMINLTLSDSSNTPDENGRIQPDMAASCVAKRNGKTFRSSEYVYQTSGSDNSPVGDGSSKNTATPTLREEFDLSLSGNKQIDNIKTAPICVRDIIGTDDQLTLSTDDSQIKSMKEAPVCVKDIMGSDCRMTSVQETSQNVHESADSRINRNKRSLSQADSSFSLFDDDDDDDDNNDNDKAPSHPKRQSTGIPVTSVSLVNKWRGGPLKVSSLVSNQIYSICTDTARKTHVKVLEKYGICVRYGQWAAQEDQMIRENCLKFMETHGISNCESIIYPHMADDRNKIKKFIRDTEFHRHLCCGLNRTVNSCIGRSQRTFGSLTRNGVFTEEEVERLKHLLEKHGYKCTKIGHLMGRTGQAIQDKLKSLSEYQKCKQRIKWTREEDKQLIKGIENVLNIKNAAKIDSKQVVPWVKVAHFVPSRTSFQCRRHWQQKLYFEQCNHSKPVVWSRSVKASFIEHIYFMKIKEEPEIDWQFLYEKFKGKTILGMKMVWYEMKVTLPNLASLTFDEIRKYLYESHKFQPYIS